MLVLFHVLEHLPDPLTTLAALKKKMVSSGTFIFEVPHANDFLISVAKNEHFKQFTLWSQHLILHTRDSLTRMLKYVGLKKIKIDYVQRYPLSNHLNWLANGKPGGHTSDFSIIDNDNLNETYSYFL